MAVWSNTTTGLSSTNGYVTYVSDNNATPFANIGFGCIVNSTAVTYNVEHTFDYTGSSTFTSSLATWFQHSTVTAQSTNANGSYTTPISAMRLNVTAGSSTGTVTLKVIQAGR